MKSVRTMAFSLFAAGAAAGNLWAGYPTTGVAPLPEARYPIDRTAYEPTTAVPVDNGGPIVTEDSSESVMHYPAPHEGRGHHHEHRGAPAPRGCNGPDCVGGDYAEAMDSPWEGSDSCELPGCGCGPRWFASAAGLVMTRDNGNKFWTSYEDGNNPNQLMNTQDADADWGGGFEARIGKCCGCYGGFEALYWGIWGLDGEASVTNPNGVATPIDVGGVTIAGFPAQNYFDGASIHRLTRENEFHNVEINWLQNYVGCSPCNCGGPLSVSFLAGFRYFRFEETLTFASAQGGSSLDDPAASAYLDIEVENNLIGFQVGARADYTRCRWALFAAPKVGIYGNHVEGRSYLHNGNGELGFDIEGDKDDVAILASLDLGVDYHLNDCWKAFIGYRAVAATGVALSDEQIPPFLVDAPAFADIDTNGSLILHGAFAGLECRF